MNHFQSTEHATTHAHIDTQRHVNSRVYEQFCFHARMEILRQLGLSPEEMLEKDWMFTVREGRADHKQQQFAGAILRVNTDLTLVEDGELKWKHSIVDEQEQETCRIEQAGFFHENRNDLSQPVNLHERLAESANGESTSSAPFQGSGLQGDFPDDCKCIETPAMALYSMRNAFNSYNPADLWRFFEDARWNFSESLGLTADLFLKLDTGAFFIGAEYLVDALPKPGAPLITRTWIESVSMFRAIMRHDLLDPENMENPLARTRETSIIVSLSRGRPTRAPDEYLEVIQDYIRKPTALPV